MDDDHQRGPVSLLGDMVHVRPGLGVSHAVQMVSHLPRGIRRDNLRVSRGVQDRLYRLQPGAVSGAVDRRVKVGCRRRLAHGRDQAGRVRILRTVQEDWSGGWCAGCAPYSGGNVGQGAWFPRTAEGGPRQWCVRARTLRLLFEK